MGSATISMPRPYSLVPVSAILLGCAAWVMMQVADHTGELALVGTLSSQAALPMRMAG